tara:strand:- start:54 stop:1037 length:984 start_codon:yes stop_codon:yes gene_type:complete
MEIIIVKNEEPEKKFLVGMYLGRESGSPRPGFRIAGAVNPDLNLIAAYLTHEPTYEEVAQVKSVSALSHSEMKEVVARLAEKVALKYHSDIWAKYKKQDFFDTIRPNSIIAEIGVLDGEHAAEILQYCKPKELWLIDPWENYDTYQRYRGNYEKVKKLFANNESVKIIKNYSVEASKLFEDHYFDVVYIDGNHSYDYVKADIAHWLPKVKKDGFICGDDFNLQASWPGVYRAVAEFIIKYMEKDLPLLELLEKEETWAENDEGSDGAEHGACSLETFDSNFLIKYPQVNEIIKKWATVHNHIKYFRIDIKDIGEIDYKQLIDDSKLK